MALVLEHYFALEPLPGRVVRVKRTPERFGSMIELERVWSELNRSLDRWRRHGYALLVDTREAPSRNDEEFERMTAPLRARMFTGFERCAVLARTPAGQLQVRRHAREDDVELEVFADEPDAIAFLALPGS